MQMPDEPNTPTGVKRDDRLIVAATVAIGVVHLVTAIWMVVAPRSFFDTLATFGVYNEHFQYDLAAFEAGIGLALLAAAKWTSLRVGAVATAFAVTTFHAVNHWFDINAANDGSHADLFGAVSLTGLAIATGWLLLAVRPTAA